jgi:hypothetical protein
MTASEKKTSNNRRQVGIDPGSSAQRLATKEIALAKYANRYPEKRLTFSVQVLKAVFFGD